jgi:hypothetical protein
MDLSEARPGGGCSSLVHSVCDPLVSFRVRMAWLSEQVGPPARHQRGPGPGRFGSTSLSRTTFQG